MIQSIHVRPRNEDDGVDDGFKGALVILLSQEGEPPALVKSAFVVRPFLSPDPERECGQIFKANRYAETLARLLDIPCELMEVPE